MIGVDREPPDVRGAVYQLHTGEPDGWVTSHKDEQRPVKVVLGDIVSERPDTYRFEQPVRFELDLAEPGVLLRARCLIGGRKSPIMPDAVVMWVRFAVLMCARPRPGQRCSSGPAQTQAGPPGSSPHAGNKEPIDAAEARFRCRKSLEPAQRQ